MPRVMARASSKAFAASPCERDGRGDGVVQEHPQGLHLRRAAGSNRRRRWGPAPRCASRRCAGRDAGRRCAAGPAPRPRPARCGWAGSGRCAADSAARPPIRAPGSRRRRGGGRPRRSARAPTGRHGRRPCSSRPWKVEVVHRELGKIGRPGRDRRARARPAGPADLVGDLVHRRFVTALPRPEAGKDVAERRAPRTCCGCGWWFVARRGAWLVSPVFVPRPLNHSLRYTSVTRLKLPSRH